MANPGLTRIRKLGTRGRSKTTFSLPSHGATFSPSSQRGTEEEIVKELPSPAGNVYSRTSAEKDNTEVVSNVITCGTGYLPVMQELQRAFLMRAECPRFSNKSTSTTQWERELTYSKSAYEFQTLRQSEESPSVQTVMKSSQTRKMPWYATVIQEKDRHLLMMKDEISRLTALEDACLRKDEELAQLKKEVKELQKQLQILSEAQKIDVYLKREPSGEIRDISDALDRKEDLEDSLVAEKVRKPPHFPDEGSVEAESKVAEEEEKISEEEAEEIDYIDRELEEVLMAKINEYEQINEELQAELEITRNEYSIIAGTILSLQRQVDFQESQLQKTTLEKENLQKELRERKAQLQAMSDKFASLREERKREEMMGIIEKDNLNLRQHVSELEFELRKREDVISEYDNKINKLQAQVNSDENQMQHQEKLYEELQSRYEEMQLSEQQYRVLLENSQVRLERLRSKVMQAAFSATGIKSPATEITDNDILEALQRIINERLDFYQQLKQKGVKVPPLHQSEVVSSSKGKKK
ncbi:coiled-coil domain-containing protein 27 [Sarcophilus harrisii]